MSNQGVYLDEIPLQNPNYVPVNASPQPTTYYPSATATAKGGNGGSYSMGMYICIGLILLGIVFSIIAAVSLGLTNHNQQTMNSFIAQWHSTEEERMNHAELPSRMVSVSGSLRGITLCAIQTYHREPEGYKPLLTQTIEDLKGVAMKDHTYHHINVRLYLSIYKEEEEETKNSVPQLSILYNMTSTLQPFSTILLEELAFDTEKNTLGAMRRVVLCSNTLNAAQRCDDKRLLSRRNVFIFHGQDIVPLDILATEDSIKGQATVDLVEEEPFSSLRMYNIVFYADETRILTIEPLQC